LAAFLFLTAKTPSFLRRQETIAPQAMLIIQTTNPHLRGDDDSEYSGLLHFVRKDANATTERHCAER